MSLDILNDRIQILLRRELYRWFRSLSACQLIIFLRDFIYGHIGA